MGLNILLKFKILLIKEEYWNKIGERNTEFCMDLFRNFGVFPYDYEKKNQESL